jgi:phosphoribosylformylglycinamidine synthase
MVRTNNLVLGKSDAAIILLKESVKALSIKSDCNSRYVYLNPHRGGMIAVAEAARNVVCTGARPLAITNCLNFGNPYNPEVYWQFKETVRGIGEACRFLNTPVTGGNVSFYNEGPLNAVYPTPVIGMLGLIEDLEKATTAVFKGDGDAIILLGKTLGHIGGSEYLATIYGTVSGDAPDLDLIAEKAVHEVVLQSINEGLIKSAHDCSEGGLAVAVTEGCLLDPERLRGAEISPKNNGTRWDWTLFGEDQSRIVVTAEEACVESVLDMARELNVEASVIGQVRGSSLNIGGLIDLRCDTLSEKYFETLRNEMEELST